MLYSVRSVFSTGRSGRPHVPIKNAILRVSFIFEWKNIRSKDAENEKNEFLSRRKNPLYGTSTSILQARACANVCSAHTPEHVYTHMDT